MNENLTQNLNSSGAQVNSSSRKAEIVQYESHLLRHRIRQRLSQRQVNWILH